MQMECDHRLGGHQTPRCLRQGRGGPPGMRACESSTLRQALLSPPTPPSSRTSGRQAKPRKAPRWPVPGQQHVARICNAIYIGGRCSSLAGHSRMAPRPMAAQSNERSLSRTHAALGTSLCAANGCNSTEINGSGNADALFIRGSFCARLTKSVDVGWMRSAPGPTPGMAQRSPHPTHAPMFGRTKSNASHAPR